MAVNSLEKGMHERDNLRVTTDEIQHFYFHRLAAALVRGLVRRGEAPLNFPDHWLMADWRELPDETCAEIAGCGLKSGIRLHRFKRTMKLPRVAKVLGILQGLRPCSLLDVGSGRGAFLWPLMDAFPCLPITVVEVSEERTHQLSALSEGGVPNFKVHCADITRPQGLDLDFDVVTALEVLEHIPDVDTAIHACLAYARRAFVLSVPSREDDNPEHIHLLTRERLQKRLSKDDRVRRTTFEAVHGHLIAVTTLEEPSHV